MAHKGMSWDCCFFISFINDMFYHIKNAKQNAYADDHQIYTSNVDPMPLDNRIFLEMQGKNDWYQNNVIIVNESKH